MSTQKRKSLCTWHEVTDEVKDHDDRLARLESRSSSPDDSKASAAFDMAVQTAKALEIIAGQIPGLNVTEDQKRRTKEGAQKLARRESMSFDEAYEMLRQAAEEGDEEAQRALKVLEDQENDEKRDKHGAKQARAERETLSRLNNYGRVSAADRRSQQVGCGLSMAIVSPTPAEAARMLVQRGQR